MANYKAIPPKQNKLDTLEKIKEHLGEEVYSKFDTAMQRGQEGYLVKPSVLRELTGKGDSQIRRYKKVWRKEHEKTN